MKFTKIVLSLALIGTMSLGMADDIATSSTDTITTDATTTDTLSVDEQIAAIQEAPAQERVRLMNQFKQRLANMNEEDRVAAIQQLQTQMQARTTDMTAQSEDAAQAMTQARTRTQEMQLQTNEEATQMQNMNQNRAGNQFANMPTNSVSTSAPMNSGAGAPSTNFLNR